jgi:hypothetical protein
VGSRTAACRGRECNINKLEAQSDRRYPPGSLVPVSLADAQLPVSHYFAETKSNAQMVSISVYLNEQAAFEMPAPSTSQSPAFRYPMEFTALESQASTPKRIRQRPSTAPGGIEAAQLRASSLQVTPPLPAARLRAPSPLSSTGVTTRRGLGLDYAAVKAISPLHSTPGLVSRGSMSSSDSYSTDEQGVPSLACSLLSLNCDPSDGINVETPEAYETNVNDWLQAKQPSTKKENESNVYYPGKPGQRTACA